MADDYRDKIEQIRARRSASPFSPGANQGGGSGFDPGQALGAQRRGVGGVGLAPVQDTARPNLLEGLKSPWLRDRVTLSLEGQIAMLEQRNAGGIKVADLGYTNRIPVVSLRPGLFVKIEPPGTYRLVYHNR